MICQILKFIFELNGCACMRGYATTWNFIRWWRSWIDLSAWFVDESLPSWYFCLSLCINMPARMKIPILAARCWIYLWLQNFSCLYGRAKSQNFYDLECRTAAELNVNSALVGSEVAFEHSRNSTNIHQCHEVYLLWPTKLPAVAHVKHLEFLSLIVFTL